MEKYKVHLYETTFTIFIQRISGLIQHGLNIHFPYFFAIFSQRSLKIKKAYNYHNCDYNKSAYNIGTRSEVFLLIIIIRSLTKNNKQDEDSPLD